MVQRVVKYLHWALFLLFIATAIAAFIVWLETENLPLAGFIAVIAAFFATASAFLERLFPRDGYV